MDLRSRRFLEWQRTIGNRGVQRLFRANTNGQESIQRASAAPAECRYERGEVANSRTSKGILDLDVALTGFYGIAGPDTVVVGDFAVGEATLKASTLGELRSSWIDILEQQSTNSVELIGFTDCAGREQRNVPLRENRARAVADQFPKLRSSMTFVGAAPIDEYLTDNATPRDRALNRSVIIRLQTPTPPPPAPIPTPSPDYVMITLKEPDTTNCSKDERRRLAVAFPAAGLMIQCAINSISDMQSGTEEEALLLKYFGKDAFAHRWDIKQGFVDTLRAWSWDPTYECHKQGTAECTENPPMLGYVAFTMYGRIPHGNIHVCAKAFELDDEKLAAVVLHETSHRLDWTRDKEYCGMETNRGCPSLDTADAEDNADSYAQFAREAFHRWC